MEFLKMYKPLILTLLFVVSSISTFSQSFQATSDAFKSSYLHEQRKGYDKAVASLKTVYSEKSYEVNLRLGWLTYLSGSLNESITFYKKAMDLKPYAIEPCLGYAYPASALGKWDEILEIYSKILSIDPNNTLVSYRKGLILYNRGDFQNAEKYFEKVVNLYPFDYDGLHMLAWTKLKLQKVGEAKVLFQKALYNHPSCKSDLDGLKLIK
jgi:tetratricopeptide (TPR) repeat protein